MMDRIIMDYFLPEPVEAEIILSTGRVCSCILKNVWKQHPETAIFSVGDSFFSYKNVHWVKGSSIITGTCLPIDDVNIFADFEEPFDLKSEMLELRDCCLRGEINIIENSYIIGSKKIRKNIYKVNFQAVEIIKKDG